MSEMKQRLKRVFAIDPRSLGLFRIAFGLTLVLDLVQQAGIMSEMTTDAGSLPRDLHSQLYSPVERWSLYLCGGSWAFSATLYALTFAALGAFIVGYRTRWATVALWILLTSLHNRHPMFGTASDSMRRLLLFWGYFLPLGCRFSLDRHAGRERAPRAPILSVASAAILLQVLFVYVGAGLAKDYETWVRKGTATILAMRLDYFATRFGQMLLHVPAVLRATSAYTWWVENLMPLVALSPFYNSRARLVAIAAFVTLHVGLFLTMFLGAFPLLMIAAWMLFLPPPFWSWLAASSSGKGPVGRVAAHVESCLETIRERLPRPKKPVRARQSWVDRTAGHAVAAVALTAVVMWNAQTIGGRLSPDFPRLIKNHDIVQGMQVLRLTQSWEVFSPHPSSKDGWLMVVATLHDGSQVDLFRGGRPVDWTKPEHVADIYTNTRWTKYSDNLTARGGRKHRRAYVEMHVRRWNAHEPRAHQVKHVELVHMVEMTLPDLTEAPPKKETLWQGTFD